MDPCTECFAEIDFQPSNERTLFPRNNEKSCSSDMWHVRRITYIAISNGWNQWNGNDIKTKSTTYKLLLFIGHQFNDFTFTSCQYFFVVSEVTYNEFLLTCMQLELFNHLLNGFRFVNFFVLTKMWNTFLLLLIKFKMNRTPHTFLKSVTLNSA